MRLEKKITIGVTNEERNTLKAIIDVVEEAFNIEIEENSDVLLEVIMNIYNGYNNVYTSVGTAEIEYNP